MRSEAGKMWRIVTEHNGINASTTAAVFIIRSTRKKEEKSKKVKKQFGVRA